jgi:spermidine synthase
VLEVRVVGPRQAILLIDGMESSFHDLDDPTHLEFEYMQQIEAVVAAVRGEGTPLRALHLGGAGCSLATAWDVLRPGSMQLAVEWDGELARLAREWFPLPRSPRLRIRHGDARAALDSFPAGRWDVIVRDVFVRAVVPPHLRDLGAARSARRALGDDGVYVVNLADSPPLTLAREEVRVLGAVFEHVTMVVDPAVARGRRYGNVVVAAAPRPIDAVGLARRVRALPLPARVVSGLDLTRFAGG